MVRQFFLRDYPEEKAVLHALAEILDAFDGLVTYNGKTFDVPLLETRYALARLKSPFARLLHLDALHPARRLWRLRLESCKLRTWRARCWASSARATLPARKSPPSTLITCARAMRAACSRCSTTTRSTS